MTELADDGGVTQAQADYFADNYRVVYQEPTKDSGFQLIQQALQRGQLTGTNRFVEQVEHRLGQRIEHRGQGRPRSVAK